MRTLLKFFSYVQTSYVPALILLSALFLGSFYQTFEPSQNNALHICFYVLTIMNVFFLFWFKNTRNLLFVLLIFFLYFIFNSLRDSYADINNLYLWLSFIVPINIFIIFRLPQYSTRCFLILIAFLAEGALIENIHTLYTSPYFNLCAIIAWSIVLLYTLISISIIPSTHNTALFFASILIWLSFLNVNNTSLFILYLFAAECVIFSTTLYQKFYTFYYDEVTGVYSFNTFKAHDTKKFPPKYTIAFFYIDNYIKLLKVFGQIQTNKLVQMILKRISPLVPQTFIYRLKDNEFCFVFFDNDIKQTYDIIEDMRRLIAGTEFVLSKKKIIKLTITPVVSEKRRSDADVFAVLMRMYENFHQKYRFTQNMTFCEEIERSNKNKKSAARSFL